MSECKFHTIPESLKELLNDLEYISQIEPGKKLNLSSKTFSDSGGFTTYCRRRITGEGAGKTVDYLDGIIEKSINSLNYYQSLDGDHFDLLIEGITSAKEGIKNLKMTYHNDPNTVSKLSVIIKNIDIQLKNFRTFKLQK